MNAAAAHRTVGGKGDDGDVDLRGERRDRAHFLREKRSENEVGTRDERFLGRTARTGGRVAGRLRHEQYVRGVELEKRELRRVVKRVGQ